MSKAIGDKVEMTSDAVENYGGKYEGKKFTIARVASAYMPSKEFFAKGRPDGFHPGYDEVVGGELYDLDGLEFSLYEWEVE